MRWLAFECLGWQELCSPWCCWSVWQEVLHHSSTDAPWTSPGSCPSIPARYGPTLADLREQTNQIEESTRSVIASPRTGKAPLAVEVQEAPGLSRVISAGGGTLGEVLLAITFVPFLVYFMLTWKDHAHSTTVRLFPKEHRLVAHRTVGRISGDDPEFYRRQCSGGSYQCAV